MAIFGPLREIWVLGLKSALKTGEDVCRAEDSIFISGVVL